MAEPVRLVVWDLDGTFWAGTLTEGGYTYSDTNHNIIIELAKRGIVSSICSKNDFETVKAILVERGIWDYIVFPSINWHPKGPRLKQLVEDVQLRPETILLLDDNPLNLREAEHFVPGLQTADDTFIPQILESPLFKGKNDAEFSRLKQYKLLETRKADEAVAEDNFEFLRSCDIRVTIEHDVEQHLDRAIELINRTNQLNFTKNRLPEDLALARAQLREELKQFDVQAGLVRVTDRYGDYGYCGFYLVKTRKGRSRLQQFCFSCRILNMGVENWMYQRLGSPRINVVGEVLTDLSDDAPVDWINVDAPNVVAASAGDGIQISKVVIRGACMVSPLVHYFQMDTPEIAGEFNYVRGGLAVRVDHSLMTRYAVEGLSAAQMEIFEALGYEAADFATAFAERTEASCLRILSTWIDTQNIVYRHKATGLLVPYKVRKFRSKGIQLTGPDPIEEEHLQDLSRRVRDGVKYLHENFEFVGVLPDDEADRNLDAIIAAVPEGQPLFLAAAAESAAEGMGARRQSMLFNRRVFRAIERHPGKAAIPLVFSELTGDDENISRSHFHRNVYYRVYQEICARYRALNGAERSGGVDDGLTPVRSPAAALSEA